MLTLMPGFARGRLLAQQSRYAHQVQDRRPDLPEGLAGGRLVERRRRQDLGAVRARGQTPGGGDGKGLQGQEGGQRYAWADPLQPISTRPDPWRISGIAHPTTVSPTSFVTPYTPLSTDADEASTTLTASDVIKIQLGAQIDGFGAIVGDTVVVPSSNDEDDVRSERLADLLLATYWANELLLRLMVPPGLLATGTEEEKKKAGAEKPLRQAKISSLLQTVVESYGCSLVENTTSWLFERNEIEGKKKIVLAPGEGVKGDGVPDVGEAWGVEMGVSLGSGKVKTLDRRPTLHRRTTTTYGLKRPSSRQLLSEVVKKFGTFPFSLRQLEDERGAKMGVLECVRGNVLRQYDVVGDKDGEPVARIFSTVGEYTSIFLPWSDLFISSCYALSLLCIAGPGSWSSVSSASAGFVFRSELRGRLRWGTLLSHGAFLSLVHRTSLNAWPTNSSAEPTVITKNGLTRLSAPPSPDLSKYKTDKKISDKEVLRILEQPLARSTGAKGKNKKKKKPSAKKAVDEDDEESSEED